MSMPLQEAWRTAKSINTLKNPLHGYILGASRSYLTHCSTLSTLVCSIVRASSPNQTRNIDVSPERKESRIVVPVPSCRRIGRALKIGID